jgi:hypothetical protein
MDGNPVGVDAVVLVLGVLEGLARAGLTAAAAGGRAGSHLHFLERGRAFRNEAVDITVGNSIADADDHVGVLAGRFPIRQPGS